MLEDGHAQTLQSAGLDYYNNHLDSAPDFYGDVTTTRDNQDRLDTLVRVRSAGVKVEGTPLAHPAELDRFEFVRTIAVARIALSKSFVRLSAGRQQMSEAVQALCFLAGANSIFYGEKLLTTGNPDVEKDRALLDKLGISPLTV